MRDYRTYEYEPRWIPEKQTDQRLEAVLAGDDTDFDRGDQRNVTHRFDQCRERLVDDSTLRSLRDTMVVPGFRLILSEQSLPRVSQSLATT